MEVYRDHYFLQHFLDYHSLLNSSNIGHLGYFQYFAITNEASMCMCIFILLKAYLQDVKENKLIQVNLKV